MKHYYYIYLNRNQNPHIINEFLTGAEMKVIGPGGHFGIGSLLLGMNSIATVKTLTHVQIISISSDVFRSSLSVFPTILKEIQTVLQDKTVLDLLQKIKKNKQKQGAYEEDRHKHKTKKSSRFLRFFEGKYLPQLIICKIVSNRFTDKRSTNKFKWKLWPAIFWKIFKTFCRNKGLIRNSTL